MPTRRAPAAIAAAALLAAACSEYLPLPEASAPTDLAVCDPAGLQGEWRLTGDADAVPHVWAVGPAGERIEVAWPPGFKSVFWPELLVLDEESKKIGHEGDDLADPPSSFTGLAVCVMGEGAIVYREG